MSYKNFRIVKFLMAMFIAVTVSMAVSLENVLLAVSAVGIGMISMILIKRSVKEVLVDEMVQTIAGKSALMTYSIVIPVLAALSLILMFSDLSNRGSETYNLGINLSYIVLFNMAVYSLAYYYYRNKYGRDNK